MVAGDKLVGWMRELFLMGSESKTDLFEILSDMIDVQSLIMAEFQTVYTWSIDRLCGFMALSRSILRSDEQL